MNDTLLVSKDVWNRVHRAARTRESLKDILPCIDMRNFALDGFYFAFVTKTRGQPWRSAAGIIFRTDNILKNRGLGGEGNMASHVEDKQSGRGGQDSAQRAGAASLVVILKDWCLRNGEMGTQQPGFFVCLIVIHFVRSESRVVDRRPGGGCDMKCEYKAKQKAKNCVTGVDGRFA